MGLLDGDLTPVVGAAFGWLMLDGTLHRRDLVDNGKGGMTENPPVEIPIKVMVDASSSSTVATRASEATGLSSGDLTFLILAQGVPMPKLDDEVTVHSGARAGRYHLLPPVSMDAAQTHYVARGRAVE